MLVAAALCVALSCAPSAYETRVLNVLNVARADAGLSRLAPGSCVDRLAEHWAARARFVHRDQQLVLARCDADWAGEVLVRSPDRLPPRQVVGLWLASPAHRAVLLKPRARRAGVAFRVDALGRVLGVANLTDPRGDRDAPHLHPH